MKSQMVEIIINNQTYTRRCKPCKILTHGYKTKIPNLMITLDFYKAKRGIKAYGLTHIKSGCAIFADAFSSISKAQKMANMFFADCDWTQSTKKEIENDLFIKKQYQTAVRELRKF